MDQERINKALAPLILSASGWRKVFAHDGNEESLTAKISKEDRLLAAAMAWVFSDFILTRNESPRIALGIDSRPTGPAIAEAMIPIYLYKGVEPVYTGVCAAPEIMAWSGTSKALNGFCYISASHNPAGHNGVKFGLGGGVIGGSDSADLIDSYRALTGNAEQMEEIGEILKSSADEALQSVLELTEQNKASSYDSYYAFTRRVASGREDREEQKHFFAGLKEKIKGHPLGVIAEQNGSARSLSIDREYLTELGVNLISINDEPGRFVHRIVPEGFSLDLCREKLEKARRTDEAFLFGYVPDCDGDRGNIVYFNDKSGQAQILEAQEVFALSVLSELTGLAYAGEDMGRAAVAVNGPTSMRIDRMAQVLGARVFRAEVGEANVVNLAASLREQGFLVPILGEGSNGGNITHPARVRDPLNTLSALMKLMLIRDEGDRKGLFHLWCEKSGREEIYREDFTLSDIIASLPRFTTTSAFEEKAKFPITTMDHGALKAGYEEIFPGQWELRKEELKSRFDIWDWEERNMEGTEERIGVGRQFRSGKEKGGFKILFLNKEGRPTDYIWMRGSGTEPVFRVLADCEGDDREREAWFLDWHKEMITLADGAV